MRLRILLADDHPLLLKGTQAYLHSKGHEVVATAQDGIAAYYAILKHQPHIAILDFDMPKQNGLEVAKAIFAQGTKVKVILLTLHQQEAILSELGHCIAGYLTKDTALEELDDCLNAVLSQKTYQSSTLKNNIHIPSQNPQLEKLTASELKILKYIEQEYTSAQIAEELFISKRTVEKHRSNIIEKLNLDSQAHSLLLWLKQNKMSF